MKRGYKPFVLIRHENDASQSLYKKLGFERIFDMARIVFTPYEYIKVDDDECDEEEGKNGGEEKNENGHEQNGNHANQKANGKCNGVNNHHHNI